MKIESWGGSIIIGYRPDLVRLLPVAELDAVWQNASSVILLQKQNARAARRVTRDYP